MKNLISQPRQPQIRLRLVEATMGVVPTMTHVVALARRVTPARLFLGLVSVLMEFALCWLGVLVAKTALSVMSVLTVFVVLEGRDALRDQAAPQAIGVPTGRIALSLMNALPHLPVLQISVLWVITVQEMPVQVAPREMDVPVDPTAHEAIIAQHRTSARAKRHAPVVTTPVPSACALLGLDVPMALIVPKAHSARRQGGVVVMGSANQSLARHPAWVSHLLGAFGTCTYVFPSVPST